MEMKKNNQRKGKFIDSRKYIVVFNISIFISILLNLFTKELHHVQYVFKNNSNKDID